MSKFIENLETRRLMSATYYVATTGSDSGAGSQTAPLATIQAAANKVKAGDTVIVEAGTYAGFVLSYDTPTAGTATAPITFEADPNAAKGSVIIGSRNNKTPTAIDLEPGSDYVTIKGFTITNVGDTETKAGIKATGNYDQILDNTVTGAGGIGGIFTDNANYALIQGNTVTGQLGTNTSGHGMYISGTCTGVQVLDNILENNGYHGIHLNGDASEGGVGEVSDALIEGNLIEGNAGNGINGDGLVNSVIEDNVITGFTKYGISLYTIDAGVASTGNVVANNTIDGPNIGEFQNGATVTEYNNILLGSANQTDGTAKITSSNNITGATSLANSLFVNASGGNYQLLSTASAVGAGVGSYAGYTAPATDILGAARVSGRYDAGAYEFGGIVTVTPPVVTPPVVTPPVVTPPVVTPPTTGSGSGSGSGSGTTTQVVMNFHEYAMISAHYNQHVTAWSTGDLNGDGIVNYADVKILLANLGKTMNIG